ncbi:hypothetical protein [Azoarcus sp. KH32C]|uniref:hypothetical protein n=1 Tax=Azoarcus sp. KH32C TaxID=748247 RepID=UPI0002386EC4|nr:hypothetical protein [Azoarcus sp. KH32C]BAL24444.1 hypothetical protein AZKH_2133 [Azoarcus sp. KH32C]
MEPDVMRNPFLIAQFALASLLMNLPPAVPVVDAAGESPADSASLPGTMTWTCWTAQSRILCELDAAAAADSIPAAADEPSDVQPPAQAIGRVRSYQLPRIAKQLRDHPEQLAGHQISIPAFGEPSNQLAAEELATSVICSARPDCQVRFLRSLAETVLYQDARGDPDLR